MAATLDDVLRGVGHVEDWLIAIAQHTRETKEAMQGRAGATSPGGGGGGAGGNSAAMLDRIRGAIESGLQAGLSNGLGRAKALEQQGFGGTLEKARMDYAMEQLSRQFAAVMSPVMSAFTYAATQIETRMRRMNGSEQDRLMGMIGGGAAGAALVGGTRGMLGGALLGGGYFGGDDPGVNMRMGAAGGAIIGSRYGPYGAAVGAGVGAVTTSGYSDYYRFHKDRMGSDPGLVSRTGSALMATYDSIGDLFGVETRGSRDLKASRRYNAEMDAAAESAKRRDVTPFSAAQMEAGGTGSRIQESIIRATAGADFEENNPLREVVDAILNKLDMVISAINPGYVPPPASSTDARPSP